MYRNGIAGPGATLVQPVLPLYGQNKAGSAIDASNARRVITFDVAVTDAVVAGSTDQNAVLWTLDSNTLLEGIAVRNIGSNPLASGATLKIDDTSTDMTGDLNTLAAGASNVLTFRLPTAAAGAISVDGANGFICGSTLTTTIRVQLFVVDVNSSYENA